MVNNQTEVSIVPEMPDVVPGQNLSVYVPLASNEHPGIATFYNEYFVVINGMVKIKESYLTGLLSKEFQTKYDDSINTNDKSISGAINEMLTMINRLNTTLATKSAIRISPTFTDFLDSLFNSDTSAKPGDIIIILEKNVPDFVMLDDDVYEPYFSDAITIPTVNDVNKINFDVGNIYLVNSKYYIISVESGVSSINMSTDTELNPESNNAIANSVVANALQHIEDELNITTEKANENIERINSLESNLDTVESIALQANQAIAFQDYYTMISELQMKAPKELNIGQNIYINNVGVPDLWVSANDESFRDWFYADDTSDEGFIAELLDRGFVAIGYYCLSMLETQKVDLTEYATLTKLQKQQPNLFREPVQTGNLLDISLLVADKYIGSNGIINTNASAVCTEEYIDISNAKGDYLAVYKCHPNTLAAQQTYWRMAFYDKDKAFVKYYENGSTNDLTKVYLEIPENAVYVRVSFISELLSNTGNPVPFMIIRGDNNMELPKYTAFEPVKEAVVVPEDLNEKLAKIDVIEGQINSIQREPEEVVYPNFACENDFTIVGNEIWGSKNEDTYTRIVRQKIVNGSLTRLGEIQFNDVVHLNTLDYCPENDCLITGNGANDTNTEGNCFWIIPNATDLPNKMAALGQGERLNFVDVAIRYNVDIGFKVQAIWGDGNLGQHNFVYLLSNNNEVRRAIIHKNADGSFADTYTIIGDKFTITGAVGFQGVDYYGGYIYMGNGTYKLSKIDTSTFTAVTVEYPYCYADGTAQSGVFQGVVVDKDYIWLYPNGIKDSNGNITDYLVRYTR